MIAFSKCFSKKAKLKQGGSCQAESREGFFKREFNVIFKETFIISLIQQFPLCLPKGTKQSMEIGHSGRTRSQRTLSASSVSSKESCLSESEQGSSLASIWMGHNKGLTGL